MNTTADRYTSVLLKVTQHDLAEDVRRGLSAPVKTLPCKYFYDEAGSALFERICQLPEYYLTRTETEILYHHATRIVQLCPAGVSLVELGCGNAKKARYLIEPCLARNSELTFYAIDIAPQCLEKAARRLLVEYESLHVVGLVGEFEAGLRHLAAHPGGPRLVTFLGSTIGNFDEHELDRFLTMLRDLLRPSDRFLLGFDLLKDRAVLEAAYDDSQGITALFNLNVLRRINRELAANFNLKTFRHRAVFNSERGRIEMHLESLRDQVVRIEAIELDISFCRGETIHTENCYKHTLGAMTDSLLIHSFEMIAGFSDSTNRFSILLMR